MVRVALVGCGEHSESGHAVPLARYKAEHPAEVELTAACDLNLQRAQLFSEEYGFLRAYSDLDEMQAREKLDGCILVVPVEKISQLGIRLLGLGIPCVVEKPLGASLQQVDALLHAARSSRTPNMVSVNRRFMPSLNRALAWTRSAGPLRYVRCIMTRHARREPEFLWTTAVHAVDTLRHICGEVAEANIRKLNSLSRTAEWYAINFRFQSGVAARIDVLPTAGVLEETYDLIGEEFRAVVTCPFGPQRGWRCFCEGELVIEENAETVPEDVLNGCFDETAVFLRALAAKRFPSPSIEDVFPSVKLCFDLAAQGLQSTSHLISTQS